MFHVILTFFCKFQMEKALLNYRRGFQTQWEINALFDYVDWTQINTVIRFSFTYDLLSFDDGHGGPQQLAIVINSSIISFDVIIVLCHNLTKARHRHIGFVFPYVQSCFPILNHGDILNCKRYGCCSISLSDSKWNWCFKYVVFCLYALIFYK